MKLKIFFTIIKTAWQRSLTYRFSVYAYRIGEILENLVVITMWFAIYGDNKTVRGFTLDEMVTYILVGNLIDVMIRNWLSGVVAKDIKDGLLSMFLIKPIKYLYYIISREIGRISYAFAMSIFSNLFIILIFYKRIIFNFDALNLSMIFVLVILAFILELLIAYLVGLAAFWTDEVDGIFYTVERIKKFLAGGYFPLSLLPAVYVKLSLYFPFAYSFYVPTQIYLGKMDLKSGLLGATIQIVWIIILFYVIKSVWKKGLKKYEGVGI